jgi:hypothetical protein
MQHSGNSILYRIRKALQLRSEHVTHERLPERWVELIQYLDARDRADEEAISKIDANTDANRKKTLPPSKG